MTEQIRLEDYGILDEFMTLHETLKLAVGVAGEVAKTRPLTASDINDITDQVTEWIRAARPACGATCPMPDSSPRFEFRCTLSGFHEGNDHYDENEHAEWTTKHSV